MVGFKQQAKRVSFRTGKPKSATICQCCGLSWDNEKIPICVPVRQLDQLGPGFPLYFKFVLFLILNLFLIFVISGIYSAIRNYFGDACEKWMEQGYINECFPDIVRVFSISNRKVFTDHIEKGLNFFVFILLTILTVNFRGRMKILVKDIDKNQITPSDYTLLFNGIPQGETEASIKDFFEEFALKKEKVEVYQVSLVYKIGEYVDWGVKKQNLLKQQAVLSSKTKTTEINTKLDKIKAELTTLEGNMKKFELECKSNIATKFSGLVFVSFNTQNQAKKVLKQWKLSGIEKVAYKFLPCLGKFTTNYKGHILNCQRAPEPSDVFWENLGYSTVELIQKRFMTNISNFVLLVLVFFACFGISVWQDSLNSEKLSTETVTAVTTEDLLESSKTAFIMGISYSMSLLILLINNIFRMILRRFAG